MSSRVFLQTLQNKLKGGNFRSIHLNALPGRLATRLDFKNLDLIDTNLSKRFLDILLTKSSFEFKISYDNIDLNEVDKDTQKKLLTISKRLDSIIIENDDYFKEHGVKTLGFGYPILIKRSTKDPAKVIKAPLFIWPLEAIKSKVKKNEWTILRNRAVQPNGKTVETDIHSVSTNEVFLSLIKSEDNLNLPRLSNEALEDTVIDKTELITACAEVLEAINSGSTSNYNSLLTEKFAEPIQALPDSSQIDVLANNRAYIHFGGVFGLFRAQKESIITDISKLLERFDEFEFDKLEVESLSETPFSAVKTDPSQQVIIRTLGQEVNQIIQGPPGTGKSQSLTALITNALANDLKCLVVCEKKTALDVIKKNIERTDPRLAELVGVIDDVNDDREAIVDSVRNRQNINPYSTPSVPNNYDDLKELIENAASSINEQHKSLANFIEGNKTWPQLVGRFLNLIKKYTDVPLKSAFLVDDFKAYKNEASLDDLLRIIGQANLLYNQSKEVQSVFESLNDELFINSKVGEARLRLEQFTNHAINEIPNIEKQIQTIKAEGIDSWSKFIYSLPEVIQKELAQYEGFIVGRQLTEPVLPISFGHEIRIHKLIEEVETLISRAIRIRESYSEGLYEHYNTYQHQLVGSLTSYNTFIDHNIKKFGRGLLDNSKISKFKASFLSIFLSKHKELIQSRLEIRSRIADVRRIHEQLSYIHHEYNDHTEATDLNDYISNIKELFRKTEQWGNEYPKHIENSLSDIRPENFHSHADLTNHKKEVASLLSDVMSLISSIQDQYNIITSPIKSINIADSQLPDLKFELQQLLEVFKRFRKLVSERLAVYQHIDTSIRNIEFNQGQFKVYTSLFDHYSSLDEISQRSQRIVKTLQKSIESIPEFRTYHDWRTFILSLSFTQQQLVAKLTENLAEHWSDGFECWYLSHLLMLHEPENLPKNENKHKEYIELKKKFDKSQIETIISNWQKHQIQALEQLKLSGKQVNSLFNKKGAKGMRRNSLRKIVNSEFSFFTDFFPVLLLNPSVCSSLIPLEEGIFDLVIFDEASQLRLEDTYAALIRGKAKVVSGDKHQMAPSSYFESSGALLDPLDAEDDEGIEDEQDVISSINDSQRNLADSESLLAYAVDSQFKESYLKVHYRSQHPYLIDFSNHAFYGKRLIPVPAKHHYTPIAYIEVNGVYENQVNMSEANKVVSLLREILDEHAGGPIPSIGVATFNIYQRNLILEIIAKERQSDPNLDTSMVAVGDSFFVKNLENIQGDERDIIILSTTFGRKSNGSFTQSFGRIIQSKGHRMLNVIITRAKQKVYVCTSFPQDFISQYPVLIQQKGNTGRGVLYAYLTYAKAVSDGNKELRNGILHILNQHCTDKHSETTAEITIGSESPFEDEVCELLIEHFGQQRIVQQYSIGGFRIDISILSKQTGEPFIAIECDGAKYHNSPEAFSWDCFRQEQLEQYGFIFYRIWSTNWWDSRDRELHNLIRFIESKDDEQ